MVVTKIVHERLRLMINERDLMSFFTIKQVCESRLREKSTERIIHQISFARDSRNNLSRAEIFETRPPKMITDDKY